MCKVRQIHVIYNEINSLYNFAADHKNPIDV